MRKLVMFRSVEFGKEIPLPTHSREKLLGFNPLIPDKLLVRCSVVPCSTNPGNLLGLRDLLSLGFHLACHESSGNTSGNLGFFMDGFVLPL